MMIITKKCVNCGEWKDKNEFYNNRTKKDGLSSTCKICAKEYHHKWYAINKESECIRTNKWRHENPDKLKVRVNNWRKNNLEKARGYARKYVYKNHDKVQNNLRKWRKENPEKRREQDRKWFAKNPSKIIEYHNNRRARENGSGETITSQEWQELKKKYNFTCLCCKKSEPEIKLHLDHIIPLVQGGKNIIGNAQPLCKSCNSHKGRNHVDYTNIYVI